MLSFFFAKYNWDSIMNAYKKNCPEAPFYQGAAGLKPKGMICDSKDSCLIAF